MFVETLFFALAFRGMRATRGESQRVTSRRSPRALGRALLRATLAVCLLLGVGAGVVWVGGDALMMRVENLQTEVGAEGAGNRTYPRRLEMWQATWRMAKGHPFVGIGGRPCRSLSRLRRVGAPRAFLRAAALATRQRTASGGTTRARLRRTLTRRGKRPGPCLTDAQFTLASAQPRRRRFDARTLASNSRSADGAGEVPP